MWKSYSRGSASELPPIRALVLAPVPRARHSALFLARDHVDGLAIFQDEVRRQSLA